MLKRRVQASLALLALVAGGLAVNLAAAPAATALPQSTKIALIPGPDGPNGGTLPEAGWKAAGFAPTFTDVLPTAIQNDATDPLAAYDTAVIYQVCNIGTFLADSTFNSRITNFVSNGGKLIVWDSECASGDYTNFMFPFTSSNPGGLGQTGTLTINENSTLGSADPASPYYVNAPLISTDSDAVGDANVLTTYDGNWCTSKQATNYLQVSGPVQTYAEYGKGLVIYQGLDADYLSGSMTIDNPSTGSYTEAAQNLGYIWELMLRQTWNPAQGLPCSQSASGITLSPTTATNQVGTGHTVTATLVDNAGKAISGVVVTFTVIDGPHKGTTAKVTSDANGKAAFTYTGTKVGVDKIQASATFAQTDAAPVPRTSNVVTKTWTQVAVSPPTGIRPDAWIKMSGAGFIGNDIYNRTARHQTVKTTAVRGDVQTFVVRIYNDGKAKGTFTAKATGSTSGVKIRYFSGGKNVTAAMTSATGLKFTRAAKHLKQFRVEMTVKQTATIGAKYFAKVMASSTGGVVRKDAVKAVVTVSSPTTLPTTGGRG